MSDAGGAEAEGQDLDFGVEKGLLSGTEGLREGAFSYRSDPMTGELTGGPAGARGADGASPVVAPELGAGEPAVIPPKEEPVIAPEPAKPAEKKPEKPVITRAKRRRSLLTEEEGGILRKPTVYRRSILGR